MKGASLKNGGLKSLRLKNFTLQASNFQLFKKNHEKIYKPDSVLPKKRLLFIYVVHCCNT